jgi:transposase
MSNQLKMAKIDAILALHQRRWSIRRIAKELGLHRDTVARHIRACEPTSKQAGAPIGSDGEPDPAKQATPQGGAHESKQATPEGAPIGSKQATPPEAPIGPEPSAASDAGRQASLCEPWRQVILDKLQLGLTAQRIWQDLVSEHGFTGRYSSVRRFVQRVGHSQALPFRRMECEPGEEVQVDFGTGIPILQPDGKRRRTHVFRMVLSHSRKGFSEVVYRQTTEEFLRCLEDAFWHFGGLPRVIVLDNLKAGVDQPDWFDPELNPKLRAFADYYGLAVMPTKPRTPRHKGKIESGVGYVKNNALKGRAFSALHEQNRHLLDWETTVADQRIHGTMRQQVGKVFTEVEQPALRPLPAERFACFQEGQRKVSRDGHVEVAKSFYSAPPEYLGDTVWVRWDARVVRIFNRRWEQIAVHVRREPGRFSTQREHLASEKISAVERGAEWLLRQARRLGPQSGGWAEAVIRERGIEGVRVVQGLLSLAKRHRSADLEKACAIAVSYQSYRLRTIRGLLKQESGKQEELAFADEHPIIRNLSDYGEVVRNAFHREAQG